MNLQDHIEYIRNRCIDAIGNNDKMSVASFESGEGLIMTFNEAIEIVNEIYRLEAQKAQLLEALIELYDNQNDALLERHRARWEAAMAKARAAIENAEKT